MITGTRYRMSAEIQRQARLSNEIARGQADVSTNNRLQAASDDPLAAARVSELARAKANQAIWKANIETAASQAAQVDGVMGNLQSAVDRVRELMISGSNATLNDDDRAAIVTELRGIADDIRAAQTTKDSRGQAIFPSGDPLLVPIADGLRVASTASRTALFEGLQTAGGTADLDAIVDAAADALALTDPAARSAAADIALGDVGGAVSHLASARAEQGVRAARIDAVRDQLEETGVRQEEERQGLEDTDVAATVARINAKMLSLQAAQAVFARVNKSTLFDLLG